MDITKGLTIGHEYSIKFHSGFTMKGKLIGFSPETIEINLGKESENLMIWKEDIKSIS